MKKTALKKNSQYITDQIRLGMLLRKWASSYIQRDGLVFSGY